MTNTRHEVYFWPAKDGRATVLASEPNPLTGKWRFKIEYIGAVTGETTTQWVGSSAIGVDPDGAA